LLHHDLLQGFEDGFAFGEGEAPNMAKASFTPVGNCADSLEPLLRWSLATGHAAEILDE
jgi:hypothetical protein